LLFGNLRSLRPGRGFDGCILGARLILLGIAFDLPELALALGLAVAQQIADRFFDLAADVFGFAREIVRHAASTEKGLLTDRATLMPGSDHFAIVAATDNGPSQN